MPTPQTLIANDIEGTFNYFSYDWLNKIMTHFRLPPTLVASIKVFLTKRTMGMRIDGEVKNPAPFEAGQPQGSPLLPVQFILYTSTISVAHQSLAMEPCYVNDERMLQGINSQPPAISNLTDRLGEKMG